MIDEILRKAQAGTRVIYIPGNHDEAFRDYAGLCLAGIELAGDAIHQTADGRRLLVLHGDHFDGIVTYARWLAHAGDWAYSLALRLNDVVAGVRRRFGMPYWSLSRWLKDHVKNAVEYIGRFEDGGGAGGGTAPGARRRLRPYPQGRDAADRPDPLLQRRRLGRELYRAG